MAEEDTPKIHIDSDWKAEAQAEKERLQLLSPARGGAGDRGGPERSAGFMIRTLVCACVLATASGLPCSGAGSPVNAVAIKLVGNEPGWSHVGDSNWRVDEQGWIFPPAWPEARITYVGSYSYDLARTDYAFYTGATLADVELSVDFRIYYGTAPYAGVAFRAQDSARCYLVEVRAVARDFREYRVILWRQDEAGIWHELAAAEHCSPSVFPTPRPSPPTRHVHRA